VVAAEPTIDRTIRLKSFAREGDQWFTVSVADKTCECPEFQSAGRCKHLTALGIHRLTPFTPTTHPTFSQALSGLVKSLRVRRVEDAVYWLVYLDSFREPQFRFRTARRLLIGAAEDGHSIAVMEKVRESFSKISKPQTELISLVAEAVRICKLPNWWHPDSGGHDYIYQSLVGERAWLYKRWDHSVRTVQHELQRAVEERNRAMALGAAAAFWHVQETFGATRQAFFLAQLAAALGHELAARLCEVHLSARSALSRDNNFLCQAAWMMAGGVSPVAEQIVPVTADECESILERARERWRNPQPIPRWCVDGLHSAGDDVRFTGMLPNMMAVCNAFKYYKRVDPSDEWLPEFRCYDGLIIEPVVEGAGGV
jgi:SWIM zinc finger